jgi:hypothetical protein
MSYAMLLRGSALLIAIAGMIDPALTITRPTSNPLTIAVLETASLALPDEAGTRRDRAFALAERLRAQLSDHFGVTVRAQTPHVNGDPCGDRACVVISDGARPRVLTAARRPLGAVKIGRAIPSNVAITEASSASGVDLRAAGVITVVLEADRIGAEETEIDVYDGSVLVGSAVHKWSPNRVSSPVSAVVRVHWAPIVEGIRELRVVARTVPSEATSIDNEMRIAVDVQERARRVLVHEAQPTWAGTFVRRALAADPRFHLLVTSAVGRGLLTSNSDVRLRRERLSNSDVGTIIVTFAERLTTPEVDVLDQFARLRGGSVVLLFDAPPTGVIAKLLPNRAVAYNQQTPITTAGHEPTTVTTGPLQTSEFVAFDEQIPGTSVIAKAREHSVVISRPVDAGRVVAFGASDAWRFRDNNASFDRFWQSLIADAVASAGDPVSLTVTPSVVRPGEPVELELELRTFDAPTSANASANLTCGKDRSLIRLWPSNSRGRFRALVRPSIPSRCQVHAEVNGARAVAPLIVTTSALPPRWNDDELSAAVAASGGTVVSDGEEASLVRRLQEAATRVSAQSEAYPMRSALWILPFAACLCGEWWLRRRGGRR